MDSLAKNDIIECRIDGYSAQGMGIARHRGMVVFVSGAARGDECLVRVVKALKNRAYGIIEQLLIPSTCRIDNDCPAYPKCGGCDFRHISYTEELELKASRVTEALRRLGGLEVVHVPITPAPDIHGYRNKAQFPVGSGPDGPMFGFYRRRSHDIVAAGGCMIQDARASALAAAVCRWAGEALAAPYSEAGHCGLLRHIYVRTGSRGCHLCLVINGKSVPTPGRLVVLARQAAPDLTGVVLNFNSSQGNTLLGQSFKTLWGSAALEENLMGFKFELSPQSFFQVNRQVAGLLYNRIMQWAGSGGLALDLYCGIGTITLPLSKRFKQVIGVEIVPQAVEDAKLNARRNGVENARFLCADAGQAANALEKEGIKPDIVVCDPPRKGMDAAGIEAVAKMQPEKIIYVACDPSSLARDAAVFCQKGWQLDRVEAFDMFPRTANVESLCLLVREQ